MQTAIITLLIVGILIFISTLFMNPQYKEKADSEKEFEKMNLTKEEKQSLIENASIEIVEITQDKIEDAKDKLEKISNEKLMAVGEFSDTVLGEMDKTHKEIMFLYNMLNEKEAEIKKLMQEKNNQAKLSKEEMDSLEEVKEIENTEKPEKKSAGSKTEPTKSRTRKSAGSKSATEESASATKTKATTKRPSKKKEEDDSSKETSRENNNEQIIALYQDGVSIVDIAKKLNLGKGEVKLVVDLFSQKNK
ncbi:MAG: hypothetical protein IJA10_07130 [Lachnospiraceae bacterium]|nr:hypothetical protein [Lachnospiraceae bacterium]